MSSLRISHQNQGRAAGLSASAGDTTRSATPDDARFADTLGAAGMACKSVGDGSSDSLPGNAADGMAPPRRRTEAHAAGDATAALVAEGLAGPSAADGFAATDAALGAAGAEGDRQPAAGARGDAGALATLPASATAGWAVTTGAGSAPGARPNDVFSDLVADGSRAAAQAGPAGDAASQPGATPSASELPPAAVPADPLAAIARSAAETTPSVARPADDLTAGPATADPSFPAAAEAAGPSRSITPGAASGPARSHATPTPSVSLAAPSGSLSLIVADTADDSGRGAGERGDDRGRFTPISVAPAAGDGTAGASPAGADPAPASAQPAPTPALTSDVATSTVRGQVADALVRLASSGSREMVIRLHPAELGDLTVRVAVNGRDVTAWFASPQPQVQSAISDAMGQLQAGLGNAGYNLSGAWVGGDGSGAWRQSARSSPSPSVPAATGDVSRPGVAGSRPLSSGMSIYV
ncbi:MAG TPA: flagellar hook-length control protein FliK [Stellaceae bacterium]|nr:flagellar hook-length control protein FliK [Stellaceae bacterium]